MKAALRRLLHAAAPWLAAEITAARGRRHAHRLFRQWGCDTLTRELVDHLGSTVQEGPFAGITLTPSTYAEHLAPYLLGVYESELDDAWSIVLEGTYPQILDIGAKFGYYAIALARRYPQAKVVAFDTDWWARRAMREMRAVNRTPNVAVARYCTPRWLEENVDAAAFVISDCEGFEDRLFAAGAAGNLETATLIIETHDDVVPGVTARLCGAFERTHRVQVVRSEGPRRVSTRDLRFLTDDRRTLANREIRPQQNWLLCLPASGPNAGLA